MRDHQFSHLADDEIVALPEMASQLTTWRRNAPMAATSTTEGISSWTMVASFMIPAMRKLMVTSSNDDC